MNNHSFFTNLCEILNLVVSCYNGYNGIYCLLVISFYYSRIDDWIYSFVTIVTDWEGIAPEMLQPFQFPNDDVYYSSKATPTTCWNDSSRWSTLNYQFLCWLTAYTYIFLIVLKLALNLRYFTIVRPLHDWLASHKWQLHCLLESTCSMIIWWTKDQPTWNPKWLNPVVGGKNPKIETSVARFWLNRGILRVFHWKIDQWT